MIHDLQMPDAHTILCTLDLRESSTCKPELMYKSLLNFAGIADENIPRSMITRHQLYGYVNETLLPLEQL